MKNFTVLIVTFILLISMSVSGQWSQVNTGTTVRLESMAVTDANTVYIVGYSQPAVNWKTTNGGLSWFSFASSGGGISVYFLNANTGFLDGMTSLQMTTNAGNTWTTVYTPTDTAVFRGFHFPNATTGYGVGMSVNSQNQLQTALIKTTNGGVNWTRLAQPISGTGKQLQDVFFTDANTGYIVGWGSGSNVLMKTTNGGNNWSSLTSGVGSEAYGVKFTDQNTGYICGQGGILKTTNAGVSWTTSYSNNKMNNMYFINANTGFAVGNDGIIRTNNAGATWTIQYSLSSDLYQIMFYGNYVGYAAGKDGLVVKTTNGGSIGIQPISTEIPSAYSLSQNYPNPFNPTTKIKFDVVRLGDVKIVVYDVMGREVQTLVNESLKPGTYEASFDGSTLNSGVYFYKLITDGFTETKKMLMLK